MTKLSDSFVLANSVISVFGNTQDENTKKLLSKLKIQKSQAGRETI